MNIDSIVTSIRSNVSEGDDFTIDPHFEIVNPANKFLLGIALGVNTVVYAKKIHLP